jgi:Asp-tRNA(Asn)/Glu-tRNA(Gln) amidotransferase A subunit family amidase
VTAATRARAIPNYASALVRDGLRGARIGVLHQAYDRPTTDAEVKALFGVAIEDLRRAGAIVVDSVPLPELDSLFKAQSGGGGCNPFKYDLERWIASTGSKTPLKTLEEIIRSGRYHPSIQKRLESAQEVTVPPEQAPGCKSRDRFREGLRAAVVRAMDRQRLDALIYPTWSNPPRLIGDLNTPHGDNNQLFSPSTGFPAITVPMGYLRGGVLPAGLQFFGKAWSEPVLIRLAYSYEQATHHRRPPTTVPPLR